VHFDTAFLSDAAEVEKHIRWAVDLCRRKTDMSREDLQRMEHTLRTEPARASALVEQMSAGVVAEINQRYRVYCLGPDVGNMLMWAHYAESHRGICLEYSLRNDVMCCALKCEYVEEFQVTRVYSHDESESLRILLGKANAWAYEREYRLIAQERSHANTTDTLLTDNGFLKLPDGALTSIIVGCQGDLEQVEKLASSIDPRINVRQATRVASRYAIRV
jgi:hypothetical protein